jgi:hypothetical protein
MWYKNVIAAVLFVGAVSGAVPAHAGFGDIISSFRMPAIPHKGLAYDGEYLWFCGEQSNDFVRVTTAGSVVSSFLISAGPAGYIEGAAFDGRYLWCAENESGRPVKCYKFTTAGAAGSSFSTGLELSYAGMAAADGHLWVRHVKFTTAGSLVGSFPPGGTLWDLAWDGRYLYSRNCRMTTTGSIVASFALPTGIGGPAAFDGSYLWTAANGWCYQVDVDVAAVDCASFGKVKALYR